MPDCSQNSRPNRPTARVAAAVAMLASLLGIGMLVPQADASNRAFELVSPSDKNASEVGPMALVPDQNVIFGVGAEGGAVAYASTVAFPGALGGGLLHQHVSSREGSGWATVAASPPMEATDAFNFAPWVHYMSDDLSKAVVSTNAKLAPGAENLGGRSGLYLQDHSSVPATYSLLSVSTDPIGGASSVPFSFSAATPDLSHVIFNSSQPLLPGAPTGSFNLYEWANGDVRFVGVIPDGEGGEQLVSNARIGARDPGGSAGSYPGGNPVSEDGSRIYFRIGANGPLYLRENANETKIVSASERDEDDPQVGTTQAVFQFATADGSKAFFTSPNKLTDDATADGEARRDLYRWDAGADIGERLTNLTTQDSQGAGVLNQSNRGASVFGSDDGSHVYFVATGDLASGAEPGEPNLYLWRENEDGESESVRHIATLLQADESMWSHSRGPSGTPPSYYRTARVSDDGRRLLFASRAQVTAYDNNGYRQIYLYDAEDHELSCVSCSPLSSSSTGDAELDHLSTTFQRMPLVLPRNLSADGRRAFFQTPERLVPQDTNNRMDVYEWHDGELKLVSDGQSSHAAEFLGAGRDGQDVFFVTRARLVGHDSDHLADVYNAKVGGGFPEPVEPEPCLGDECQAPPSAVPADLNPGSADFDGTANQPAPSLTVAPLGQKEVRRLARGRRIAVRADVSGPPGRIIAAARATLRRGGSQVRVGRAITQVQEAGRVWIRGLSLRRKARRVLRRQGRLRVRVVVRYAGERQGQRLNIRRPDGGRR